MGSLSNLARETRVMPAAIAWFLSDLGEARGKQELFTRQSPEKLEALRRREGPSQQTEGRIPRAWQSRDVAEDGEMVNWAASNGLGSELGSSADGSAIARSRKTVVGLRFARGGLEIRMTRETSEELKRLVLEWGTSRSSSPKRSTRPSRSACPSKRFQVSVPILTKLRALAYPMPPRLEIRTPTQSRYVVSRS